MLTRPLTESELSLWSSVDELTLNEAAYLWCELSPPATPPIFNPEKPETLWPHPPLVNRMIAKLKKAVRKGELRVSRIVHPKNEIPYDQETVLVAMKTYYLSIEELKRFAISLGQEPKFLFSPFHIGEGKNSNIQENSMPGTIPALPRDKELEDREPAKNESVQSEILIKTPTGTTWEDLSLVIRNNDLTEILEITCSGKRVGNYSPAEIGFRGYLGPGKLWTLLTVLAKSGGELRTKENLDEIKPTIGRLRKLLRSIFPGIKGDPIKWYPQLPGHNGRGWQAKFQVRISRYTKD